MSNDEALALDKRPRRQRTRISQDIDPDPHEACTGSQAICDEGVFRGQLG